MDTPGVLRKPIRSLGLSVFNPDNSSDDESELTTQPIHRPGPTKPLPNPQFYSTRPPPPSTSSISITTSNPSYTFPANRAISPINRFPTSSPNHYVSSPSSRSSPAPDTTPPPTTPSSTVPLTGLPVPDDKPKPPDGLGLNVVEHGEGDYSMPRPRIEGDQNDSRRPPVRLFLFLNSTLSDFGISF